MTSRTGLPKDILDYARMVRDFSLIEQIALDEAVFYSKTVTSVDVDSYYFGLSVASGKTFFLDNRSLTLTQGAYRVDVLAAPHGFTGGAAMLKSTFRVGVTPVPETNVYYGVTPVSVSGLILVEEDYVDSGSGIGSSRATGAVAEIAALKIFPENTKSILRVQRQQTSVFSMNLQLIAWEEDNAEEASE